MNNGLELPAAGIGTYSLHGETCFNAVYAALKNGVRLIDTAYMYGNEAEVGRAVRRIPGGLLLHQRAFLFAVRMIFHIFTEG